MKTVRTFLLQFIAKADGIIYNGVCSDNVTQY